jgi:MFS family permease
MVSAQAALGDVVPPSERGRYSGLFGAVFGVSSVAGPLLGGFLTSHTSWRWIFYVNLPVGIIALVVLAATLPAATERRSHAVDYLGTLLLAAGLSAIILLTTLGGNSYDWGSWQIVLMGVVGVVCLVAFWRVERRAAEPILPPALFANRVFVVTSAVGLVVGFALFGALTYLPLFQQVVRGLSPTASGLQLLPVMAGLLCSSIVSGQVIARTGRYKAWPIAGTAIATLGLWLLSGLDERTGSGVAALHMLILGLGLGMVMQVLILAVQNAVPYEMLGVATSGATLFRSMGGALGTALLGAVFTAKLTSELPGGRAPGGGGLDPAVIDRLPAAQREVVIHAFTDAVDLVFLVAAAVALVAFALTWLIPERPLRATVDTTQVGDALGGPIDTDSLREATRELYRVIGRDRTLEFIGEATKRAGVDLAPGPAWALMRLGAPEHPDVEFLKTLPQVRPDRLDVAVAELRRDGLLDGDRPTPAGAALRERLVAARVEGLRELVAGWEPDRHPELDPVLARVAAELTVPA